MVKTDGRNHRGSKKKDSDWDLIESFCYGELGLSAKEYYSLTLREYQLRVMAYERMAVERWQHTRFLGLKMLEPYLSKNAKISVFDILPLPGDPTEQERKEQASKHHKEQAALYEEKVAEYRKLGIIK